MIERVHALIIELLKLPDFLKNRSEVQILITVLSNVITKSDNLETKIHKIFSNSNSDRKSVV